MSETAQNLLSARSDEGAITIGLDDPSYIRSLSDSRRLRCPGCGSQVIFHAGSLRVHHFAHLPGAVCSLPQTEPETEEHREGKLLLARWLRKCFAAAEIAVEAHIAQTNQRADLLLKVEHQGTVRRVALEFQCADLSSREWQRRHGLYRSAGIEDFWLLGASRFSEEAQSVSAGSFPLRTKDLERGILRDGAPLCFLDSCGLKDETGTILRFHPVEQTPYAAPEGRIACAPLLTLSFPWNLLNWSEKANPTFQGAADPRAVSPSGSPVTSGYGARLWDWLASRYKVTPNNLPSLFGVTLPFQDAILCEPRLWQAAVYYRFVHRNIGEGWWLQEVVNWSRAYLPLSSPVSLPRLNQTMRGAQDFFSAAGLLSTPLGYQSQSARVVADLNSLPAPPDKEESVRIAGYRRLRDRDIRGISRRG